MKGELGGAGCCGGSSSSVAMAASARHPGFKLPIFPLFSFLCEQIELY